MRICAPWWVAALLATAGCWKGSSDEGDAGGGRDADAVEGVAVRVVVLTQDRRGARTPAPGALVAFDGPDGSRVEQTADADGRTTFEGVHWRSGETAAVIAYLEGWQVGGIVAMTESYVASTLDRDGELRVVLGADPASRDGLVQVRGTATISDSMSFLLVGSTTPGRSWAQYGADWSVAVARDEPFSLVAGELENSLWRGDVLDQRAIAWAVVDHDGVAEPVTVDVDLLARPIEPERFAGSLETPEDSFGAFLAQSKPFVDVWSLSGLGLFAVVPDLWIEDSGALQDGPPRGYGWLGVATSMEPGSPPAWTYEGEYVNPPAVADPATRYVWQRWGAGRTAGGGSGYFLQRLSSVVVPGVPIDGSTDLAFPEPPQLVLPAPDEALRFGDVIEWQVSDRDAAAPELEVLVSLWDLGTGITDDWTGRMTLFAPAGTTSLRLPRPPSTVDPVALIGDLGTSQVVLCELDPDRRVCLRSASSPSFDVVP